MSRLVVALAFFVLSIAYAPPAIAAPPSNDDFNNATVVKALPFTDSVDMSGATVASDDPVPSCAGPAGNGSGTVWYAFTPTRDAQVHYDALGSSFEPGVVVYTGARGSLSELPTNCSGGFFPPTLAARAGVTYYFLVQNFNGNLVFNLTDTTPDTTPPVITTPAGVVANATSPDGAVVSYVVDAHDNVALARFECAPASGSAFPIGQTIVTCTAIDAAGNTTSAAFIVKVRGAPEQTADLIDAVLATRSLGPLTATARSQLEAAAAVIIHNNPARARAILDLFIAVVRAAEKRHLISDAQGSALISEALQIKAVIGP